VVRLGDERREVVRRGYDRAGAGYLTSRPVDGDDVGLLDEPDTRLPRAALVIDVGCGAGVPVAALLLVRGHRVIGLDLSMAQLALAGVHTSDLVTAGAEMSASRWVRGRWTGSSVTTPSSTCPETIIDWSSPSSGESSGGGHGRWSVSDRATILTTWTRGAGSASPMYWCHYDADTTVALVTGGRIRHRSFVGYRRPDGPRGPSVRPGAGGLTPSGIIGSLPPARR
jgi:hypothetical protein